jgi:acetyl esterase/lipase
MSLSTSTRLVLIAAICLAGCSPTATKSAGAPASTKTLTEARADFKTTLAPQAGERTPVEQAPPDVFSTIKYPAASGQLAAYLTPDPGDGKKHPAIVWITGGDCNSIGDVWSPAPPDNDQTAAAFRSAGIVMMFPSLRGGNDNPGAKEGFLGEVDDVLSAAKYLETIPYVDPQRIYLGGHSTGGTLVLLVAECSDRFRAVFSFGPAGDVSGYGDDSGFLPFDTSKPVEVQVRSPGYWLASIQSPVWVIEGETGNIESLTAMQRLNKSPLAHFVAVPGVGHFDILKPATDVLATKIVQDTGGSSNISLTAEEIGRTH